MPGAVGPKITRVGTPKDSLNVQAQCLHLEKPSEPSIHRLLALNSIYHPVNKGLFCLLSFSHRAILALSFELPKITGRKGNSAKYL